MTCAKVVLSVAVQDAAIVLVAAVGVHVTGLPIAVEPFLNCTVPVGPAPLLVVVTLAVSVTLPPEMIVEGLGVTCTDVVAWLTVSVLVDGEAGAL